MEKLIPFVINKTLEKKEFDPNLIYESLLKETDVSEENAKKVVKEVVRKIISMGTNIKHITSPMIREITNVTLLQYGLEKERLKYTRIGFPYYDLEKIVENNNQLETDAKILKHIKSEFSNVEKLIKIIEKPKIMTSLEYTEKRIIKEKIESKKISEYFGENYGK